MPVPERFPDVPLIAEWPDVALPPLNVDHYTAFVAVTHDPKIDDPALLHAFERDCFYIGALGSRKTHAKRGERLKAQGASDADIARIHAPIGLNIGAVSPSEIAVAIMAEITAQLRLPERKRERGMKFGPASPADAIGGVTVHTLRQGSLVLKKGTTIGPAEVEALTQAGVKEVVVVRLEDGDVSEDVAAGGIAQAIAGEGVNVERAFTGRSNLFAARAGVLVVDRAAVDRINRVDEAITFATLAGLQAGGRRRDDRDRQDRFRSGSKRDCAMRRWRRPEAAHCGSRPTRSSASASSRPCCRAWRRR